MLLRYSWCWSWEWCQENLCWCLEDDSLLQEMKDWPSHWWRILTWTWHNIQDIHKTALNLMINNVPVNTVMWSVSGMMGDSETGVIIFTQFGDDGLSVHRGSSWWGIPGNIADINYNMVMINVSNKTNCYLPLLVSVSTDDLLEVFLLDIDKEQASTFCNQVLVLSSLSTYSSIMSLLNSLSHSKLSLVDWFQTWTGESHS